MSTAIGPFGAILNARHVERAIEDHCRMWLPSYIAEVCRQDDLEPDFLPVPGTYVHTAPDFDKWPEHQLPTVIITSIGATSFDIGGDGSVAATFPSGVGIVCKGRDKETTERNSRLYAAALRASIFQNITLGERCTFVRIEAERYDELDANAQRTLGAGVVTMDVTMPNVVNVTYGPDEPGEDPLVPPDEWPVAETYYIQVDKEGL